MPENVADNLNLDPLLQHQACGGVAQFMYVPIPKVGLSTDGFEFFQ
jgi:hypothetical protein